MKNTFCQKNRSAGTVHTGTSRLSIPAGACMTVFVCVASIQYFEDCALPPTARHCDERASRLPPAAKNKTNTTIEKKIARILYSSPSISPVLACLYVRMYGHTYSKSKDQPGKVANPACGSLNREKMIFFLSAFAPENLVSRGGFGSSVPRQPTHLHTQAESGAYLTGFLPSSAAASIHLFIIFVEEAKSSQGSYSSYTKKKKRERNTPTHTHAQAHTCTETAVS